MGPNILKKQNSKKGIELLQIFTQIYREIKSLFGVQLSVVVIVPVILAIVRNLIPPSEKLVTGIALYSVVALFLDNFFFTPKLSELKTLGAKFQEKFDTWLFDLDWEDIEVGPEPSVEVEKEYTNRIKRVKSRFDNLENWYSESLSQLDNDLAILVCQRTNCIYDVKLRKSFKGTLVLIIIVILAFFILTSVFNNLPVNTILIAILAPFVPIFNFFLKIIRENETVITVRERLKNAIDKIWKQELSTHDVDTKVEARKIQNLIYRTRKENPPIFDFYYKLYRNQQEDIANDSASSIVEQALNK